MHGNTKKRAKIPVRRAALQFPARRLIYRTLLKHRRRSRSLVMSRNNLNLLRKCKGARSKDTRVRAPNEPRIIVARPSTTHPSLIAEIFSLICERDRVGRRADTGGLYAPRVLARTPRHLHGVMQICYAGR